MREKVLRVVREVSQRARHVFAGFARPVDQGLRENLELRRAGDQARLAFDAAGIEIVFGAGHAPAAPIGLAGDDDRRAFRALLRQVATHASAADPVHSACDIAQQVSPSGT